MFKDIRIFRGKSSVSYIFNSKNGLIEFETDNLNIDTAKDLKIIYDENIYDIIIDEKNIKDNSNKGEIIINLGISQKIKFNVKVNYKYFIKTIYKFVNKFIDRETLIKEIDIFKNSDSGKKSVDKIDNLLNKIEVDKPLEELILEVVDEQERVTKILLNDELYKSFVKKMTNMDLMLLITSFIFAPIVPKIDQNTFNKLVKEATEYEYSLESVWRLAMNYDYKNLDYDLIDRYFVNCKNCYYLGEYISGVAQVDTSKICSLIIESKDKGFIKEILKSELILDYLNEEDINRLNNYLIEN